MTAVQVKSRSTPQPLGDAGLYFAAPVVSEVVVVGERRLHFQSPRPGSRRCSRSSGCGGIGEAEVAVRRSGNPPAEYWCRYPSATDIEEADRLTLVIAVIR